MLKIKSQTRVIIVAGVLGIICLGAWLNLKYPVKNTDSKGRNIICFGDSITFGYGVNPDQSFPAILSGIINRPVINAGVDGDTSVLALKRIGSDVLEKEPYIVLIEFSGNDFVKKVPLDITVSSIREIVRQVQARGAIAAIVDISAGFFLSEYRSALAKLARQTNSIFISSVLNGIITDPSMKSDFLHPNAGGYKIIALRIFKAIRPYLNARKK